MAHHIQVKTVPYKNKDGTDSKTKNGYLILDRTRGKKIEVGVASSRSRVDEIVSEWRDFCYRSHLSRHPNDLNFVRKHEKVR